MTQESTVDCEHLASALLAEFDGRLRGAAAGNAELYMMLRERIGESLIEEDSSIGPPPSQTSLPMFVYGFLKPGELSYSIIQDLVVESKSIKTTVTGELWIRDGLPLLVETNGESIEGYLLFPKTDEFYKKVGTFEPKSQYAWKEIAEGKAPCRAWVLVGRQHHKGGAPTRERSFSSRKDNVLLMAPSIVRQTLRHSQDIASDEEAQHDFEVRNALSFFELQMAYMLLWSILERFTSLRYGPWLSPMAKLRSLALDNAWQQALLGVRQFVNSEFDWTVYDSRGPSRPYRIAVDEPLESLKYFYQFRSNLSHRGKAIIRDAERLGRAANILMLCVERLWNHYDIEWQG
jgi:hypothetical protein